MKNLLNQGLILYSELKPLSEGEKIILIKIKNKKERFFYSTFIILLIVIIFCFWHAMTKGVGGGRYSRPDEEDLERTRKIAPYFFSIVASGLLIYFINYYQKLVLPFLKDLNSNKKEIFYYSPDKYQTPFFAEYYITTLLIDKSKVRVSKEIFDEIDSNSKASISIGRYSRFVFEIEVDGRKINFNETHEPVDV